MVLTLGLFPNSASATVVWSDDFSDGNYDGWTVWNGTWDASGGFLEATGTQSPETNTIVHDNGQIYGTYTFDFYKSSSVTGFYYIAVVGENIGVLNLDLGHTIQDWYGVMFYQDYINLVRVSNNGAPNILYTYEHTEEFDGWYTVSVSVMSNDSVSLSFEGELKATVTSMISLYISSGDYSYILSPPDGAIDNIEVTDYDPSTITETTTTTTTTTTEPPTTPTDGPPAPIPLELIAIGIGGAAVVVIILVIVLKRR